MKKLYILLAALLIMAGQIVSNNTGLAGVTISLSGTNTAQTTTDSNGFYSFTSQSNGDYTVTPSLSGYVFSPSGTVVAINGTDKAGIDFTATASTTPTYTISGIMSGAVASGVTITLAGTSSGSTLTDSNGNYSFIGVANGSYTITPSKTGYTFNPATIGMTVNNADDSGQNFTATASTTPTYTISGTVSGAVASGVTIIYTGTGIGTGFTTTDSSGNYIFYNMPNGNYTLTASKAGYSFSPVRSITVNGANITGQNFTAIANVVPSSAKAITAFSLNGVAGTINETGKIIAVTMPFGTSVTSLVATFTTTGASVKVGSTVQINGTTANNFTSPVTYTVTAADASTQDYTVTVTVEHLAMIPVPAGSFKRDATETNISMVATAFYMSETAITRSQFLAVTGVDPSYTPYSTGTNDPVQQVNWYHALVFCNKLSMVEGLTPVYSIAGSTNPDTWGALPTSNNATWDAAIANWSANGYRLPTEMEWMWAAMGATSGFGYTSPIYLNGYLKAFAGSTGSNNIGDYAWYLANSAGTTHPVGTKLPNELGLYDMSGNVDEWCWDWLVNYPTGTLTSNTDAGRGAASSVNRVVRGGNRENDASYLTVAFRTGNPPYIQYHDHGFRVVHK